MPEPAERSDQVGWLLQPPGAGEVRLFVELGEGAQLTPEAQEALELLMKELNEADVQGYALGGGVNATLLGFSGIRLNSSCGALKCAQHDCAKLDCGVYSSQFV